ncbi:MAG: helix-turn-helix domain-containing protein [Pseudoxanthomonas sp.]
MTGPQERRSPHKAGNVAQAGGLGAEQSYRIDDASINAQRARLLKALRQGPVTTIEARRDLNIMAPAVRVFELRKRGHNIVTRPLHLHDDQGRPHSRVAQYALNAEGTR